MSALLMEMTPFAWLDEDGTVVTEAQHEILTAAACEPDTPALQGLKIITNLSGRR